MPRSSVGAPARRRGRPGLRLVRGRLAADARARRADRRAAARARRRFGSRTSPTSTSACRRAARRRRARGRRGWPSGGPTSSASPATCSRGRAASRCCAAARPPRPGASSCSGTTTSPTAATRSRSRSSSDDLGATDAARRRRRARSSVRGRRVQIAGVDPRSRAPRRGRHGGSPIRPPTCASCSATSPADPTPRAEAVPPRPRRAHARRPDRASRIPAASCCFAHPRARESRGRLPRRRDTTMHVSPGLGTTFVPVPLLRPARGDRARAPGRAA